MIISDKKTFGTAEKVLVECDFKASPKCKGQYYKLYKNILLGRKNNDGKDRCCYCFNSLTKAGSNNYNFKYAKNEDFFKNIDTELKAYLLGWVAGDGYIKKDGLNLEIHQMDIEILELFRAVISPDSPFTKQKGEKGKNTICWKVHSIKIVKDLLKHLKLENPGKKSDKIQFPDLPEDLLWHFLRGLFDSDGWVNSPFGKRTGPVSSICSISPKMRNDIMQLCQQYRITYCKGITNSSVMFDGHNCLNFLSKLYENAQYFLLRKQALWKMWTTWIPGRGTAFRPRKVREYYPPLTEEHKEKIRESNRTRTVSEETKQKISASHIGKHIKITTEQAIEICKMYATGNFSMLKIAEMYGVESVTINNIINGKRKMDKKND